MMPRAAAFLCAVLAATAGCDTLRQVPLAPAVGAVSAGVMADEAGYLETEYLGALGVAYALYDPWAPNWELDVSRVDETRLRFEMRLRSIISGGEGEARRVLARNARRLAQEGGFSGYEVIWFEEGVESTRPIARRVASAEVRLIRAPLAPGQ